jgi:hypothetical protein
LSISASLIQTPNITILNALICALAVLFVIFTAHGREMTAAPRYRARPEKPVLCNGFEPPLSRAMGSLSRR